MSRIILFVLLALPLPLSAQRVSLAAMDGEKIVAIERLPALLEWRALQPGLAVAEADLRAGAWWRWPVRVIVARLDPDSFDLELQLATRANGMTGVWNVDSVAPTAAFAVNAGQFKETGPWGWLVMKSYERRDPGFGPLSAGVAIDTAGRVHWIPAQKLNAARGDPAIRYAFQSYPALLLDGRVPQLLRTSGDVDRNHRDARLILAQTPDSSILAILTRYDGLGGAAERVPIGLTVPESVALVQVLGARNAVMLDGGISAQMMMRHSEGDVLRWSGFRNVPLGLVAVPRRR